MHSITWTCWGWLFHRLPTEKLAAIRSPPRTRNQPGRLTTDSCMSRAWAGTPQPHASGACMERTKLDKLLSKPEPAAGVVSGGNQH